jgi:hypothetical protein
MVGDVLEVIDQRDLLVQRYEAIPFMGYAGDDPVLPALEAIPHDDSQAGVCRSAALEAISMVDPGQGKTEAGAFLLMVGTTGVHG